MDLDMILFLFLHLENITFGQMSKVKKDEDGS